jgi:hypothetical protein
MMGGHAALERLIKLLGMLGSARDGEGAAAATPTATMAHRDDYCVQLCRKPQQQSIVPLIPDRSQQWRKLRDEPVITDSG